MTSFDLLTSAAANEISGWLPWAQTAAVAAFVSGVVSTVVALVTQLFESRRAKRAMRLQRLAAAEDALADFMNHSRSFFDLFHDYFAAVEKDPSGAKLVWYGNYGPKIGKERKLMDDALLRVEVIAIVLGAGDATKPSFDGFQDLRKEVEVSYGPTLKTDDHELRRAAALEGMVLQGRGATEARELIRKVARAIDAA